jgi:ABC-type nitrate/sulfonate/bicarbonate transport system substrate-binding protein
MHRTNPLIAGPTLSRARRLTATAVVVAATVVGVAACSSSTRKSSDSAGAGSTSLTTVHLAYTGAVPPYAPEIVIANDPSMCTQYGVKVDTTVLQTPVASPALAAGQVDMSVSAEFLQTAAKQPGTTTAVGRIPTVPLFVYGANDIKKVTDLKGKTIGVSSKGSLADLVWRQALKENGLTLGTDVKITYAGSSTALVGLAASNAIQAFIYNPPLPDVDVKAGVHEVTRLDQDPSVAPLGYSVIAANTSFLQDHRNAVRGALQCIAAANKQILADPQNAGSLLAKAESAPTAHGVAQVQANKQCYGLQPFTTAEASVIMNALENAGVAQFGSFDPSRVIDNSLLTSN